MDELIAVLEGASKSLAERLQSHHEGPVGVGLWLPEPVALAVVEDPTPLRKTLDACGLYTFTVNAFPFDLFHAPVVKDEVFRPSWADPQRRRYTAVAGEALAALLPEGMSGSISTHTGSYKPWGEKENDEDAIVQGLVGAAEDFARLEDRTGRRIVLALEPEPLSFLETTPEVVRFFGERLLPEGETVNRHLGICYDACHQAVEYEDMALSVAALRDAGISIAKVQLTTAIVVTDPGASVGTLASYAEDRWLHQVVARGRDGTIRRIEDLPLALDDADRLEDEEWRIHFHVPLFAESLDEEGLVKTTRPWLEELLKEVSQLSTTPHLEIETYSFDLIPEMRRRALGAPTLLDALEKEYLWVLQHIGSE